MGKISERFRQAAKLSPVPLYRLSQEVGIAAESHSVILGGVFHDPVAHVRQAVHLGARPGMDESVQTVGPETPVTHAPDQQRRPVGQRRQLALDLYEGLPRRMAGPGLRAPAAPPGRCRA